MRFEKKELINSVLKGLHDKFESEDKDKFFDTFSVIREYKDDRAFNQLLLKEVLEAVVKKGWARQRPNEDTDLTDLSHYYEIRSSGIDLIKKYASYNSYYKKQWSSRFWQKAKPVLSSFVSLWIPIGTLIFAIIITWPESSSTKDKAIELNIEQEIILHQEKGVDTISYSERHNLETSE